MNHIHADRVQREVEYLFSNTDNQHYPYLARLLHKGFNFIIIKRFDLASTRQGGQYLLASESICSNGAELRQRLDLLTPEFSNLQALEEYTASNMLHIMRQHFLRRELAEVR